MNGTAPSATTGTAAGSGQCAPSGAGAGATPSDPAAMNSADMALSTFIGGQAGIRLAGNAPLNLDAQQVKALGDRVTAGASVDSCADRITFTGAAVSFAVEAVPQANPDMTFRIAGLVDPTIVVQQGATVTVEFVNADSDQAHGWLVTAAQPPFAFHPTAAPAFPSADTGVIGDPVDGRQGARNVTFTAGPAGVYQYLCPMPGHAEMGMHGSFIVAP
jgi:rusticyanin